MSSTVQNIIKDAVGTPISGASVTVDLVVLTGGSATSIQGFYPPTDFSVNIPATVITNPSGVWSVTSLPGNDAIEDASGVLGTTHWKITENASGVARVYYIKFGDSAPSNIWVGDYTDQNTVVSPSTFPHGVVLPTASSITVTSALARTNIGAILDLSFATEIRLDVRVRTAVAGNLLLQYSADNATWTTLGSGSISVAATGTPTTGYVSIPGPLRTVGFWQLATSGGADGSATLDFVTLNYR